MASLTEPQKVRGMTVPGIKVHMMLLKVSFLPTSVAFSHMLHSHIGQYSISSPFARSRVKVSILEQVLQLAGFAPVDAPSIAGES